MARHDLVEFIPLVPPENPVKFTNVVPLHTPTVTLSMTARKGLRAGLTLTWVSLVALVKRQNIDFEMGQTYDMKVKDR